MHFLVVAVLVLIATTSTTAAPTESNAQRLARGLPPKRPKFGMILPGFTGFSPTPVLAAKRGAPSSSPPVTYTGRIEVRNSDGGSLGYVKNWSGVSSIDGVSSTPEEELHVTFTVPAGQNGPFDILATNPNFDQPYYAGASPGSSPGSLALGSPNGVPFINVPQTPPGPPSVAAGYTTPTESNFWHFHHATNEISAKYINPDGSKATTVIAYDIRENSLVLVGDIDAWNSQHTDTPSSAVKFFLVNI